MRQGKGETGADPKRIHQERVQKPGHSPQPVLRVTLLSKLTPSRSMFASSLSESRRALPKFRWEGEQQHLGKEGCGFHPSSKTSAGLDFLNFLFSVPARGGGTEIHARGCRIFPAWFFLQNLPGDTSLAGLGLCGVSNGAVFTILTEVIHLRRSGGSGCSLEAAKHPIK